MTYMEYEAAQLKPWFGKRTYRTIQTLDYIRRLSGGYFSKTERGAGYIRTRNLRLVFFPRTSSWNLYPAWGGDVIKKDIPTHKIKRMFR